jgi:hypothetical protein
MITAMAFFLGIVVGGAIVILAALYAAAKPAPKPQHVPTAIGLGDVSIEAHDAYLLKQILTEVDKHTLYEIRLRGH